jgi:hypothetical protein
MAAMVCRNGRFTWWAFTKKMCGEITEPHRKTSFTSTYMNTGWILREQTVKERMKAKG